MYQEEIKIPQTWEYKKIDIDKIEIDNETNKSLYSHILKSANKIGGIIQPIIVIQKGDKYRVVAGRRRVLAAKNSAMRNIDAIVFQEGTPEGVLASLSITENIARAANPADEYMAIQKIMTEFGYTSAKEVANHLGIPCKKVQERLRLGNLIPEFFNELKKGNLKYVAAKKLSTLPPTKQRELFVQNKTSTQDINEAVRSHRLSVIPENLFEPTNTDTEVTTLLDTAIDNIKKLILLTQNGNVEKLQDILAVLESIKRRGE